MIILPGGNDLFGKNRLLKIRLDIEKRLIRYGIKKKIPIIGICRGMQVLNYHFNGKIKKINNHMKKITKVFFKNKLFGKSYMMVKCFHNYGIPNNLISKSFKILATDNLNNIEMFKHNKLKIYGIMWHPEREKKITFLNSILKIIRK